MLVAVVLPFVIRGISLSARNAAETDRRSTAIMLAQSQMEEIMLTGDWQFGDTEGLFEEVHGSEAQRFTWQLTVADWQSTDFSELTLTVRWNSGREDKAVALKTVVSTSGS